MLIFDGVLEGAEYVSTIHTNSIINNNKQGMNNRLRKALPLLCMTVPFFILIIVFNYVPLWGWSMAFINYSPGISIFKSDFIGLHNFLRLFDVDSQFLIVMRNTLVLSFLNLLATPLPIILAIMITEVKNNAFKKTIQTVVSFPNFVSWITVYSLFFVFLSVDDGILNSILIKLNMINTPMDILANPDFAWPLQTFASIWKSIGYSAIIYIAAISGIDQELYQAAEVDGAGKFRKIWYITVPCIMPTFMVIMVLTIGNLINTGFDQYYVFSNSLVSERIEVLDTYTYNLGLKQMDYSFATTVGIFKTVVSVILLFAANRLSKWTTGSHII